jgi:hypothetical protein
MPNTVQFQHPRTKKVHTIEDNPKFRKILLAKGYKPVKSEETADVAAAPKKPAAEKKAPAEKKAAAPKKPAAEKKAEKEIDEAPATAEEQSTGLDETPGE